MADPGKVGIIEKEIDAVFASYLIRLHIVSESLSPYYLFYFLLSERYQGYIAGASTGATRKSASAGVITDIEFVIPSDEIRERFEDQVSLVRRMLNNLLDKNANLRRTRDLLLPKLVSGEVDVSELDIGDESNGS
jgi:type I restriction enzyme S subunit